MGLFEKLFPMKNSKVAVNSYFKSLTAYTPAFTSWGGKLYESELVRSAIDARARHISKLKVEMKGSANPKLQSRLKKAPNSFQTWGQFLYRLSTILDMQNTAFIVPVLDEKTLETIGFYPILPSSAEIVQDSLGNPWLQYTFSNGQRGAIEWSKCGVLTKFQYDSDFFGSTNHALSDTMSLIDIQNQGIREAVKSAATYRFIARVNNFTTPEDLAKERQLFTDENLRSDSKGGGLLLFPNTYSDIQQIKSAPYTVDADQMKIIQTNVYNYFGVNEDILQNKAIGDSWSAFYEGAVEVFAIQFSDVMTNMLFTQREFSQGSMFIATANRLQYMSNNDKLNVSSQMADRGIMTRNEIREIWNLPPIPGGDVATIRGEYYAIDQAGNIVKELNTEVNNDDRGEDQ